MEKKQNFWNTPYPVSIQNLLAPAWNALIGKCEWKKRSEQGTRRLLCILSLVSLVLIFIVDGVTNPLEYLVELPALDFSDMETDYAEYAGYYYMCLLVVTGLLMSGLQWWINRDEEKVWSINGLLLWVTGLAVAILADVITRNIVLDNIVIPALENRDTGISSAYWSIAILLLIHFCMYFSIEDMSSNTVSAILTPYVMVSYEAYIGAEGIMGVQLIKFLAVTVFLKIILMVLEKIGVTGFLSDVMVKYAYTPKYIPYTLILPLLLPFLPIMYIKYLGCRNKIKETE